jgi:hypothetical protein
VEKAEEENRKQSLPEDKSVSSKDGESENISTLGSTAQHDQNVTQDKNVASDSEPSSSISNRAEDCTKSDFSHKGIVAHMKLLTSDGVTDGGMKGEDISDVLQLKRRADLRKSDHKKIFCSIKPEDMQDVVQLYNAPDDTVCEKT